MDTLRTLAASAALFAGFAAPAAAQGPVSTDPAKNSPAGATYEIPLENARSDAAPKRTPKSKRGAPGRGRRDSGNGSEPVTGGSGSGSAPAPPAAPPSSGQPDDVPRATLRSDNGFGSSSQVPGAPSDRNARRKASESAASSRAAGKSSGTGGGGAAGADPGAAAEVPTIRAELASAEPSGLRAGLLAGLAALIGLGLGLGARREARRSSSPS